MPILGAWVVSMDIIKDGPRTGKWPPIHSYTNCSVARVTYRSDLLPRYVARTRDLVRDVPDAEIFFFF